MTTKPQISEERVQRAAKKLKELCGSPPANELSDTARAILEAADAPEPPQDVVTEEMLDAGDAAWTRTTHPHVEPKRFDSDDQVLINVYRSMAALAPEPEFTDEMRVAMSLSCAQILPFSAYKNMFLAAWRVMKGRE